MHYNAAQHGLLGFAAGMLSIHLCSAIVPHFEHAALHHAYLLGVCWPVTDWRIVMQEAARNAWWQPGHPGWCIPWDYDSTAFMRSLTESANVAQPAASPKMRISAPVPRSLQSSKHPVTNLCMVAACPLIKRCLQSGMYTHCQHNCKSFALRLCRQQKANTMSCSQLSYFSLMCLSYA